MAEFIRLTPPLPWIAGHGQAGLVSACGTDRLILETPRRSEDAPKTLSHITVSLGNDQNFHFQGQLETGLYPYHFIIAAEQRVALQDLLGQIRKDQHIEICRSQDVEASDRFTGFQELSFIPEALPLFDAVDTRTEFLGRTFALPLLITGMTGGIHKGTEINRRLARAAAAFGIPMGVGSQRIALENAEYAPIFAVKKAAPELFLIGNIGMAQLIGPDALDRCQRAVDMIEADALAIHFNIVQEHIQIEGDRALSGVLPRLEQLARKLSVPLIAKEVGAGISPASARRLADCGLAAIDIGGAGGTSWAHIEGLRSASPLVSELGQTFRNWGIPTAYSLAAVRAALPNLPLSATGGIRDGLTAAKAVALGAQLAGIGLPLLKAALQSEEAVHQTLDGFKRGLELTMLASGAETLKDLRPRLIRGRPFQAEFEALIPDRNSRSY